MKQASTKRDRGPRGALGRATARRAGVIFQVTERIGTETRNNGGAAAKLGTIISGGNGMAGANGAKGLGLGGVAIIAAAIGSVAVGAVAIGALAIRRLAIARIGVGKAELKSLEVQDLRVARLHVAELTVTESLQLPGGQGKRDVQTGSPGSA